MECTVSIVILKPSWCKKPQQQIEHTAAAPSKKNANLTISGSMLKYSANPPHTPPIFLSVDDN